MFTPETWLKWKTIEANIGIALLPISIPLLIFMVIKKMKEGKDNE